MYIMHNIMLHQQYFIRLHKLHIQTLRKQCIWAENAKNCHSFFVILWVCKCSSPMSHKIKLCSHICVKSCDITLPCQSPCFFGFCRCLCRFHILQLDNKYTHTLSIRGSQSVICIYDSGVKVNYTPQL